MAVSAVKGWILLQVPRLLTKFGTKTPLNGSKTKYRLCLGLGHPHTSQESMRTWLPLAGSYFVSRLRAGLGTPKDNRRRAFSGTGGKESRSGGQGDLEPPHRSGGSGRPLKLMDFEELVWPHPFKSIRNAFFTLLIRGYFDETFSSPHFLTGAEQAVNYVSSMISSGQLSELDGLVTREAQREIKRNYDLLSVQQRQFVDVNPKDIFFRFVHEIGVILDDQTNERFVEITAVFQGVHGLDDARERNPDTFTEDMREAHDQVYVCNYRFIREYTKGKEDEWIINKLNHFKAKELVDRADLFRR